ncbi:MAG: DUF6804 family protein [Terriglobia bacterium]
MLTKTMKWVSITMLLLALLWPPSTSYQLTLEILISVSALLVVTQAWRAGKYFWAAGFVAIAVLFNPVSDLTFSPPVFIGLGWVCVGAFVLSLAGFTEKPLAPMPGIINLNRRIQSQFSR